MLQSIKRKIYNKVYEIIQRDNYILPKKDITYPNDLLYTYHNADFINTPRFAEVYREVKEIGGNLLKNYDIQWRIHVITYFANVVKNLEGDFVDCGVNTGFCPMAVIKYTNFNTLNKKYFLFDTFEGMDPRFSTEYEMERSAKLGYGKQANIYEQVSERFSPYNVQIVKGAIPDTLSGFTGDKVAYLSIDMNCVLPEVQALEFFWDKMVKGGVIVLDDYGYPGCLDQKMAHDAFAKSKGVEVMSLPTCQGIIIKP
jgi:O-methyltransferase